MTIQRVLLIRHGQTTWNAERRWQGTIMSVPLNQVGRAQARALAGYLLSSVTVGAIYSSDLSRAWETAVILGETLRLTPQADPRWGEVHAGVFQGCTWLELEMLYPEYLAEYLARGVDSLNSEYRFPQGESWAEAQTRAFMAFTSLPAQPNGAAVAVVSHGGMIRCLLARLFGALEGIRLPNTSITTLERNSTRWHLVETGVTPHLQDNGSTPARHIV